MSTHAPLMPAGRVSMGGLVRSEWTKLRTVRSTIWALGMTAFVGLAASAIATAVTRARWATEPAANKAAFDPIEVSLVGVYLGWHANPRHPRHPGREQRVQHRHGPGNLFGRATPSHGAGRQGPRVRRGQPVTGRDRGVRQLLPSGQAFLSSPAPHATLSSPDALQAVAGTGLYLCMVGLLTLGAAVVVRHTAGAISAYVAVLLVLPIIVEALPDPPKYRVERLAPFGNVGSAIVNDPAPHAFGPWAGLFILCGYALLTLAVGTLLLVRRDATALAPPWPLSVLWCPASRDGRYPGVIGPSVPSVLWVSHARSCTGSHQCAARSGPRRY